MESTTPAAARLSRTLDLYLRANRRDPQELLKRKARAASLELFKATRAAAPTLGQIKQDVCSRGWRVKRKAGAWPYKPGERAGSIVYQKQKETYYTYDGGKHGNKKVKRTRTVLAESFRTASTNGPLNRMRAAQIGRRQKAIGYVSTGWLPAVYATGGNPGEKRLKEIKNPRGRIEFVNFDSDKPGILVVNSTPGILAVQAKHNVTRTAFNAITKDTIQYLRTHGHEKANAAIKGG